MSATAAFVPRAKQVRPASLAPEVGRVLDRYVAALLRGEYPEVEAAARSCRSDVDSLVARLKRAGRTDARRLAFSNLYTILRKESRALGRARFTTPYLTGESRIIERFARAIINGRYVGAAAATNDCHAALRRLWRSNPTRYDDNWSHPRDGVYQRLAILTRRLGVPRPETAWTSAEDDVVHQFARSIARGEHRSIRAAAGPCRGALDGVYRRLLARRPAGQRTFRRRSPEAVKQRLISWLRKLGVPARRRRAWRDAEKEVLRRWACRFRQLRNEGVAVTLAEVVRSAQEEMRATGLQHRSADSCRSRLESVLGTIPRVRRLPPPADPNAVRLIQTAVLLREREEAIIDSHARRLATSPEPCVADCTQACRRDMGRLRRPLIDSLPGLAARVPLRTYWTVYTYLKRRASALGQPALSVVWIPAEDRIVWRYVRDVLEGRYSSASAAAPDCRCELVRVFRSRRRANRRRAGRIPRTLDAVAGRIARLACTLGLPRMATPYDAFEHHTLLKHARAVVTGAHKAPLPAARAAYATLMRYYQRRLRRSPIRLRTLAGRPFDAIHGSINALARDLGYRGRDNRRWKPEERRIAAKWLARYRYYLRSDTAWSIPETAISLQQDLTARGFRRTITACKAELYLEKLGRIPARKFRD